MEIINLDMTPSTVTPNAHAGQYDASRTVRFMLKNGGVPFTLAGTETITAEITRSDNTEVTVNVANTSSNYVDVVFDDTVCTVKGLYACELRLKDSDGFDIGSKNFALLVQRDPYDGAGIRVVTVGPADICTFETTLPEPLVSVLANITASQASGTPTPSSPLPISGYTGMNLSVADENMVVQETYPVSWQDEAGTVYGGVLDVTRGKLTVTWLGDTINNLPFQYWAGGVVFYADITGKKNGNANVICDIYETLQNGGYGELSDGQIVGRSDGSTIYIKDTACTDVTAFKSARGNGLIVYELTTPFDIDLTPVQIRALVGVNNVFAGCGETTVKYLKAGA